MKKVLMVGLACLDIVNVSDGFPAEDTDVRLKEQIWSRGGNASNSAVVLSQLGTHTAFMGTLAKHRLSDLIVDDLIKYGVSSDLCRYHKDTMTPTSCVILNTAEGTRTILHANKTLPELCVEDFMKADLCNYQWIHFEGRNNVSQILLMIENVEKFNKELLSASSSASASTNSCSQTPAPRPITVSVELEKATRVLHLLDLLDKGHVVFISKDVAKHKGYNTAEAAVKGFHSQCDTTCTIICAWGEHGACAIGPDGIVVSSPAFPPAKLVDTLGAGDTFNAAVIHALNKGDMSLLEAITFGCKIAGKKCGQHGFDLTMQ
ncbi:ketohexokinase-like [Amphiura filiformis]|uniref:ketohexokinase-like n=1 Tax=Amphiura filiformis TaxID=82378 RepID=UPI003B20FA7F